jgi:hypothetical protein
MLSKNDLNFLLNVAQFFKNFKKFHFFSTFAHEEKKYYATNIKVTITLRYQH